MKIALTMPQFGESITEAVIVRWLKKEGDSLKEMEPLVEMETEKSVFSYESPFSGKLIEVLKGDNEHVAVGVEIAHFEVSDELGKKYLSLFPPSSPVASSTPSVSGRPISPAIRALAREQAVPLEEVEKIRGTGPEGRLTKEDFLKYLESRGGASIPVTPIRARIAEKMALSKREIPHAGTGLDVDLTAIAEFRSKGNERHSFLHFVLFCVIPSLKKFPVLNSSWKEVGGRGTIERHEKVHLGLATATEQGLLVPVIRDADRLTFQQLVAESERLIEKGRANQLEVSELTGATFTVNNTGALGALRSTQIIPPPQSGILAVNRVVKRPWVVGDEIRIRSILSLDLAFDHRLVDGDAACGFLNTLKDQLEQFDFSVIQRT